MWENRHACSHRTAVRTGRQDKELRSGRPEVRGWSSPSPVGGSLYVTENEDMANLFLAIQALRARAWFPKSVRDIRAFRIEQWSDFTSVVKS